MAPLQLVGRDAELAVLMDLVEHARSGRTRALVVHGGAGIGKTALLEAMIAASTDMQVVRASGDPGTSGLAMSGLFDLTYGLRRHLDQLPAMQRDILEAVLGITRAAAPQDRFALGVCLLSLLAAAGEHLPVLVAVDDANLLDAESLAALTFAARRLEAEPVAVVLTVRSDEGEDPLLAGLDRLEVGPLAAPDAEALLRQQAPGLDAAARASILEAALGNPLALVELPRTEPTARQPAPTEPLGLTSRLQQTFARQIRRLPPGAGSALLIAAAAARPEIEVVRLASERLGLPPDALHPAEAAGLVEIQGSRVRFRHPLVRAAAYHEADRSHQRAVHQALAEAWVVRGDPGQHARHRAAAATGPDEEVAALLEAAAGEEAHRGAYAAASAALEQAAQLSVTGSAAATRRLAAAEAALCARDIDRAVTLTGTAVDSSADAVLRARAMLLRGRLGLLTAAPHAAVADLHTAADTVAAIDADLSTRLRIEAALVGFHTRSRDEVLVGAREVVAEAAGAAADVRYRAGMALATALASHGDLRGASEQIAALESLGPQQAAAAEAWDFVCYAAMARALAEDFRGSIAMLVPVVTAARSRAAVGAMPFPLGLIANASILIGDVPRARDTATEAQELAEATSQLPIQAYAAMCRVLVAAAQGDEATGREQAAAGLALSTAVGMPGLAVTIHWGRGQLQLGLGRPGDALVHLRDCADLLEASGQQTTPGIVRWEADRVEALAQLDRRGDAQTALDGLAERASTSGSPYGLAAAARCRGILAPPDAVDEAFSEALERHADDPNPYELARTELAWGRRLLDTGRPGDARRHLHTAAEAFADLQARSWHERAREALAASGAPPRPDAVAPVAGRLSPREQRVATAIARGASIQTVASDLFLSTTIVERTLARVLDVLGLGSVEELATGLGVAPAGPTAEAPSQVNVLGRFAVQVDGVGVHGLAGMAAKAVRAVAAHGGHMTSDALAEVLWPDQPEGVGRQRLRQVLWRVSGAAGPLLVRQRDEIVFRPDIEVDAVAFERDADAALAAGLAQPDAEALAERAVERYAGDLLPREHADWVVPLRERLRRRYLVLLDRLAARQAERGDVDAAVQLLERGLQVEPLDDERLLTAAQILNDAARHGAAIRYLDRAAAVAAELGLPPSRRALQLADEVRRSS